VGAFERKNTSKQPTYTKWANLIEIIRRAVTEISIKIFKNYLINCSLGVKHV